MQVSVAVLIKQIMDYGSYAQACERYTPDRENFEWLESLLGADDMKCGQQRCFCFLNLSAQLYCKKVATPPNVLVNFKDFVYTLESVERLKHVIIHNMTCWYQCC